MPLRGKVKLTDRQVKGGTMKPRCVMCQESVNIKSCWIDDIGWLCKKCGLKLRLERMHKNLSKIERREGDGFHRSKNGHLPMVQGKSVPRRGRVPLRGMEGV